MKWQIPKSLGCDLFRLLLAVTYIRRCGCVLHTVLGCNLVHAGQCCIVQADGTGLGKPMRV